MKKNHVCSILNELSTLLMRDYFTQRGFFLEIDKKYCEFGIKNDYLDIPLYPETKLGPFFTILPSIRLFRKDLLDEINSILTQPIFTNGIICFSRRLDEILGVKKEILDKIYPEVIDSGLHYLIQIFSKNDIERVEEWLIFYFNLLEELMFSTLNNDRSIYDFYKNVFQKWAKSFQINPFEQSLQLCPGAHVSMIYLGLKNQFPGVKELIDETKTYWDGSLYYGRVSELQKYFENQ